MPSSPHFELARLHPDRKRCGASWSLPGRTSTWVIALARKRLCARWRPRAPTCNAAKPPRCWPGSRVRPGRGWNAMKKFYLLCAVAGAVIPFVPFVSWVGDHGFDPRLFISELFATRIGAFFGLDVL